MSQVPLYQDPIAMRWVSYVTSYRAISLIRKRPPSLDPSRTLGIGPLEVPTARLFLMSEVPLYRLRHAVSRSRPSSSSELIDYQTSMIIDADPLRGLLFH
jgi:hypothetical protein